MKKAKILWALMFIVLIIDSAFGQYSTDEKRADFYLDISKKYSPDSYVILKSDPDKRFVKYADNGETREALLDSYGTVVHETCHGYNFKIGFSTGWKNDGFYITDDIVIATMKGSYFPSSLLNQVVPREHQEKIFRYKTYVEGSSENSSTLEGIYGFLDEFSAYYHDTQANLQM